MDDVLEAHPGGQDDLQLLAACLSGEPDGIELSYRLLDRLAVRHGLADACLVLQSAALGPQVFFRGGVPATCGTVADLLARPSGLYGSGSGGGPGAATVAAVAGCCELALTAQVGGAPFAGAGAGAERPPATRAAIESALARAASRSARYGWPVTVLVVRVPGEQGSPDRKESLLAALASVARTGDEVGDAGGGRAMVVLGSAGPEVVGSLMSRLAATMSVPHLGPGALETATVRLPDETVDPEEVWLLVAERLGAGGAAPLAREWPGALPTDVELELRSLPGVVSVGATDRGSGGGTRLTVVAVDPSDRLQAAVSRRIAERFGEGAVEVSTVAAAAPLERASSNGVLSGGVANGARSTPAPDVTVGHFVPGPSIVGAPASSGSGDDPTAGVAPAAVRVALLGAQFDAATGTSEVTLGRGPARATGRASAGPLAGGAQATLAALGVLGVDVPFYLLSVERARSVPGEPVVSVLAARHPEPRGNGDAAGRFTGRVGVASGAEEVEAASRATLAALNRFLATQPAAVRVQ